MKILEGLIRSVGKGAMAGAVGGSATAVVLIALDTIRPFSVPLNDMVEHLAFSLCPLYLLGFSDSVKNWPELIVIVILSNAIIYGALFAGIAGIVHIIRRIAG